MSLNYECKNEVNGVTTKKSIPVAAGSRCCSSRWIRLLGDDVGACLAPPHPPTSARSRAALQLEGLALQHQLQVLQCTRPRRLPLARADRWFWVVLLRVCTEWRTALVIVKPETVIAWHRRGRIMFVTPSAWRHRRRPATDLAKDTMVTALE